MTKETAIKIKKWLLIGWLALAAVMLVFIQYAAIHIESQELADNFVKGYFWGTPAVISIMHWLIMKNE